MDKKLLRKLVLASYTKGNLDEDKVAKIVKYLKKSELREYIKALKLFEMQNTVLVSVTTDKTKDLKKHFEKIFFPKKVYVEYDKSLLAGIKIADFDNIYELNLKNKLENLIKHISE
ncbi:MAG: F0F1 ATP synthase subunit delta [Candidatus Levybacteria bacterium]|nr:F0F1 ATP synthase subunit delta [Candidatus Levybacteria bacterium]